MLVTNENAMSILAGLKDLATRYDNGRDDVIADFRYEAEAAKDEIIETLMNMELEDDESEN